MTEREKLVKETERAMSHIEVTCYRCGGKGKVLRKPPEVEFIDCPKCGGTGRRSVPRRGHVTSKAEMERFLRQEKLIRG